MLLHEAVRKIDHMLLVVVTFGPVVIKLTSSVHLGIGSIYKCNGIVEGFLAFLILHEVFVLSLNHAVYRVNLAVTIVFDERKSHQRHDGGGKTVKHIKSHCY